MQKKGEISNQTLGLLLVVSIALSVVGTFISLSKVGQQPTIYLTGYGLQQNTSTAIVNLTVDQVIDINFTTWEINWGVGSVTPGAINCTKTTESTEGDGAPNCTGFAGTPTGLTIENIGNQNATLNVSFSSNAAAFIGGQNPSYKFQWDCGEASACRNVTGTASTGSTCGGTATVDTVIGNIGGWMTAVGTAGGSIWEQINATTANDYVVCPNLDYDEDSDEIDLEFFITVPEDSFSGNLTSTVTATASVIDCQELGTCN